MAQPTPPKIKKKVKTGLGSQKIIFFSAPAPEFFFFISSGSGSSSKEPKAPDSGSDSTTLSKNIT